MEEDIISVAVAIRDSYRNPIKDLTATPPSYIRKLMEMCFEPQPSDRPSFNDITQFLLQHAPEGFSPPADLIERPTTPLEKGSSSSASSSSDEDSAAGKQVEDPVVPETATLKKKPSRPRWSQALPKDRDTLIQTMRKEEETPPLGTNTTTQGYRDVKELHNESDDV
jgi:hypothetical protein